MIQRLMLAATVLAALLMVTAGSQASAQEKRQRSYKADKGPATVDVSKFSPEVRSNYRVFAMKCGKCHTLARAINTDKTTLAWKMYVERMQNKKDSGITDALGSKIYQFLKFYQGHKNARKHK